MGGFQDWNHMLFLQLARVVHKKIAYYGRSLGPFPTITPDNRCFKRLSIQMLKYFSFLSIRDSKSEQMVRELGIPYVSTVDTAFLDSPKVEIPVEVLSQIGEDDYVVFVPNLLIWHYEFEKRLTKESVLQFYEQVFQIITTTYRNHKVVMLPQTFNYGTYCGDDIHFFYDIKKRLNDEKLVVIPDKYSSDVQQTIIGGAKCVVGARYHSVVFAINNGVPIIAMSYEHKISGLLENLGMQNCMVDISKGLDTIEGRNMIISDFEHKIKNAHPCKSEQNTAKSIALRSFQAMEKVIKS